MSLYYNSKKRRVRPWIYIAFVAVPLVLIFFLYYFSQGALSDYKRREQQKQEEDIFNRF
ncbi:MAG: hypothetical protein AB7S78_12410 [Candidatus Omnitrophota bacterium]